MIVAVADDFSGAAEIAGIAYQHGLSAEVQTTFTPTDVDCVVIDANTRSFKPSEAATHQAAITEQIRRFSPTFLYKKIDSALRGPIVAEAQAVAQALGHQRILLVNANPSHGRTVEAGRLKIRGVPIDQTHFANDPEHPRWSSEVITLLGQSTFSGIPLDVADIREQADLDALAVTVSDDVLLCGAADFFATLLRAQFELKPVRAFSDFQLAGRTLLACGSMAGSLHQPTSKSTKHKLDLADHTCTAAKVLATLSKVNRAALYCSQKISPKIDVAAALADIVFGLVPQNAIEQLLIEGGRTASTICRICNWQQLTVFALFDHGVVGLDITGCESPKLVVKPGSYAWPNMH